MSYLTYAVVRDWKETQRTERVFIYTQQWRFTLSPVDLPNSSARVKYYLHIVSICLILLKVSCKSGARDS
jgi:hypothetical protein